MTDRKIITKEQWIEGSDKFSSLRWDDLPDAPKHTDEEFDALEALELKNEGRLLNALVRIKELEAKVPPKDWTPICFGGCNVGMTDCRASLCIFRKECEEYTYNREAKR